MLNQIIFRPDILSFKPLFKSILLLSFFLPVVAVSETLSAEQQDYLQALKALESNKKSEFNRLKKSLRDYPLYPYLEYEELSRNIGGNSRTIKSFISRYADTPLADRLHNRWLKALAKGKSWNSYYSNYDSRFDSNQELQCHYLNAALRKGKEQTAFAVVEKIYMVGKSLPDACDPVFDYFYKNKKITPAMIWQRFNLAAEKRNSRLAGYLAKRLPKAQQGWYQWWRNLERNPQATMARLAKEKDSDYLRDMLVFGIIHAAREDTPAAWDLWHSKYKNKFAFSKSQINKVEHAIALRAAWRHEPEAYQYLTSLAENALDTEAREWRVRSALRIQNWSGAIAQINALPEKHKDSLQWRYWLARAYELNGQQDAANEIFRGLAQETDYYGFMSAEKLGIEHAFNNIPVLSKEEESQVYRLSQQAGFVRARLLDEIDKTTDATREWNFATADMDADQIRVAAKLAHNWGWHFKAIATIAKARHFEDLQVRFPVKYSDLVEREAQRNRINSSWVYGVIRRESAWREDVVSPAGAVGLMQLMPATARNVAKKVGMRKPSTAQIKDVNKNIRLGTAYMREVLDQYHDNEILATASYNAGPHRVKAWLPEQTSLDADIWIDTITFDETRAYVKAVLGYSMIMDWKLGKPTRSLQQRMQPVYTLSQWEGSS